MALQKIILEQNGVVTSYHRLEDVFLTHDRVLSCSLDSFVSKDYANLAYNKINSHHFSFEDISIAEEESMGIRKLAYTKIKESDFWNDAEDC